MPTRALRRQILLSTTMIVGTLTGYASRAYAACTPSGGSTYSCSGVNGTEQDIIVNNATVSTVAGFSVITPDSYGLNIDAYGDLSFTDANNSTLTASTAALRMNVKGDDGGTPGSITVNTDGTLIGGDYGIAAYNTMGGTGAISITANGNVMGTGTSGAGIMALNTSGSNIIVATGAGTVHGYDSGIYAHNQGTGYTTVTVRGYVYGYPKGISAKNDAGTTDLTVTTYSGSKVRGDTAIYAANAGSGDLRITANGDITGTTGQSIDADNSVAGTDLSVTTGAGTTVMGGTFGINAFNKGSGYLSVTANGNVIGSNNDGIKVINNGGSFLSVTANGDVTGMADGINARNSSVGTDITVTTAAGTTIVGGMVGIYTENLGIGSLTVKAYGQVGDGTTQNDGIYAYNHDSGVNLSVTTGTSAVTGGAQGIQAVNHGSGYTTVTANGNVTGTAAVGIYVTASSSATGDIVVTTYASTYGVTGGTFGIRSRNYGDGAQSITANGNVTGTANDGISAYNDASATNLKVSTGSGTTVMGGTFGINAHNKGSGYLSVTTYGAATGGSQDGIQAINDGSYLSITANGNASGTINGINARNDTGTTDLTVITAAGTTVVGGKVGIYSENLGTGSLTVKAYGQVGDGTTQIYGIYAYNHGTGDNLTVITGTGAVTGGKRGIDVVNYGSGALTITTGGNVTGTTSDGIYIYANTSGIAADITVNAGSSVTSTGTNTGDFAIDVNSGAADVSVAGTLNGGAGGAVRFANATNTLELVTGSTVTGNVVGGTGTDTLTLSGANSGSFNVAQLQNFETGAKKDAGTWTLTGTNTSITAFAVDAGTLAVNGSLANAAFTVNDGTLKGNGTLGALTVNGGTLAPGNSIGTMYVNGAFTLAAGAVYEVEVNAAGENDKVVVKGTVNLTGAALRVLAANGNYNTKTDYIIIDNDGSDAVVGTFFSITSSLAFLTPTVVYNGGTGNDVVLTLERNKFAFCSVAKTRNQCNVATALDQFPTNNALYLAVLNQTEAGARQAFDALSGEIHATVAGVLADDNRYVREAVLGRLVQATYTNNAGQRGSLGAGGPQVASLDASAMALGYPLAGDDKSLSAPAPSPLAFWTRAYGAWGSFNGDGNAATANRDLGGFVSGMDASIGGSWRVGLATGASFANVDVDARYSSADVESYTLGGYLGGMASVFALRGGGMWAWNNIDTSRAVVFPGFYERQKASYNADTGQIFGEVAYPTQVMGMGVEPFGGLAYVSIDTDNFKEHGGSLASLRGSTDQDVGYSTLGVRAATTMQWGGMTVTPNGSVAWLHAFSGLTPDAGLAFATTGIGFNVYGVPLAEDSALIDAGLDFALGERTTAGVSYTGQFGDGVTDNGIKGRFTWLF